MNAGNFIQAISIYAIPIIFAITFHEAAHGFVARHFGDMTAYRQGRVSLNPIHHIDPIGTILLPLVSLAIGGFLFGWAKPVPVNFGALRRPKQDMLWVAAAGPASNFVMALFWALLLKITLFFPDNYFSTPLILMSKMGIRINVVLMVLNMVPIPPLDGGRVMVSLLPPKQAWALAKLEPYGIIILVALLFTGILGAVVGPMVETVTEIILKIIGI